MNEVKWLTEEELELAELKYFLALSPDQKLLHLEKLIEFYQRATPPESKKMWEKLQKAE